MKRWFGACLLGVVAAALCGGCCRDHLAWPQSVNTAPLEQARLPPGLDRVVPLFPGALETVAWASR